jgi:hypothetical protein
MIRLAIALAVVASLAACQTDNSYRLGDDSPQYDSGKVNPFDSAHSPG